MELAVMDSMIMPARCNTKTVVAVGLILAGVGLWQLAAQSLRQRKVPFFLPALLAFLLKTTQISFGIIQPIVLESVRQRRPRRCMWRELLRFLEQVKEPHPLLSLCEERLQLAATLLVATLFLMLQMEPAVQVPVISFFERLVP